MSAERELMQATRAELAAAGIDAGILAWVPDGSMCTRGELVRAGELTAADIIAAELAQPRTCPSCGGPVRGGEGDYADVCTQWPLCGKTEGSKQA